MLKIISSEEEWHKFGISERDNGWRTAKLLLLLAISERAELLLFSEIVEFHLIINNRRVKMSEPKRADDNLENQKLFYWAKVLSSCRVTHMLLRYLSSDQ